MENEMKLQPEHQNLHADGSKVVVDTLCRNSVELIRYARRIVAKQINIVQLMTFYTLGRWIVEVQQHGESRAQYGQQVIKNLSDTLTEEFGKGFSVDNLENMRKFYLTYKDRISETVFGNLPLKNPRRYLGFLQRRYHLSFLFPIT